MVIYFRYLERFLTTKDDDWTEVIENLHKAFRSWVQLSWILGRKDANDRMSRHLYLAIVQTVLLFGSETWVVTPNIGRLLGGFHHRME